MKNLVFRNFFSALVIGIMLATAGCTDYRGVPPGYIGKILTPTGWQEGIHEAGMVDIGERDRYDRYNTLVLLEATSVQVKEMFADSATSSDGQDHRIVTKNGTPFAVDIYTRLIAPDSMHLRDAIFAQITPKGSGDERMLIISLQDVYDAFAQMEVRGKTRAIFLRYENEQEVMAKYDTINAEIGHMISETLKQNGVPLRLISSQISNVKVDATVWRAQNALLAAAKDAERIEKIGTALRNNPEYKEFMKWETMRDMALHGNGNNTFVVSDGATGNLGYTIPSR